MKREKRLYAFVPYQLKGIQQGIQMQHALTEFERAFSENEDYIDWKENWKTTIVLNGGTTNEGISPNKYNQKVELGTMQQYMNELIENGIDVEGFWEPDLNNTLSAFVFIAEEPVFNHEDFPFFDTWMLEYLDPEKDTYKKFLTYLRTNKQNTIENFKQDWKIYHQRWERQIGEKNAFLKYFLKGKKLA